MRALRQSAPRSNRVSENWRHAPWYTLALGPNRVSENWRYAQGLTHSASPRRGEVLGRG
jgi:hypothetical protein